MLYTSPTQAQLWQDLLKKAQSTSGIRLNESKESYLVFMLIRFTQVVNLQDIVLATYYLESLLTGEHSRKEFVWGTADAGLLLAGMYPEQALRRNVSLGYFLNMSRECFFKTALICDRLKHPKEAALYREVGVDVPKLAAVLSAARDVDQINCSAQ